MEELYLKLLESNLVNFIIMISILVVIFKKARLGYFIDKMADNIRNSVSSSAEAAKVAMDEYRAARKEARNIPSVKEEISTKAKETSNNIVLTAEAALQDIQNELDKKAQNEISSVLDKEKENTANEIYSAVLNLAEEEILKRLTPDMQQKLIEKGIDELNALGGLKI